MIKCEKEMTEIRGDIETILKDFFAISISVRNFLKKLGLDEEERNKAMTSILFETAKHEDNGIIIKHEERKKKEHEEERP